jgi:RHS repeat-associated protein
VTEQADASGLLYRRNRYYDPKVGRFTQPDPIGIAGGLNSYGFASGDPINYSDPFGLCAVAGAASSVAMGSALATATGSTYGAGSAVVDAVTGALCVGAIVKGFKLWRAGQALARAAAVTDRVIGHYPRYLQVGEAIGAKTFNIAPDVWKSMSKAAQWAANKQFLDDGIDAGAEFVMSTRRADIRAGSDLAKEVNYLLNKGYQWADNGLSLIKQ